MDRITCRAYQSRPPAGCITVGGKGMKYPNYIAALRIQLAIGVISEVKARQLLAAFRAERVYCIQIIVAHS